MSDLKRYFRELSERWEIWPLLFATIGTIYKFFSGKELVFPNEVWLSVVLVLLSLTQYRAWQSLKDQHENIMADISLMNLIAELYGRPYSLFDSNGVASLILTELPTLCANGRLSAYARKNCPRGVPNLVPLTPVSKEIWLNYQIDYMALAHSNDARLKYFQPTGFNGDEYSDLHFNLRQAKAQLGLRGPVYWLTNFRVG